MRLDTKYLDKKSSSFCKGRLSKKHIENFFLQAFYLLNTKLNTMQTASRQINGKKSYKENKEE